MDKIKASYIAGVIDGEGSIMLRPVPTSYSVSFQPIIIISNTNRELLETIKKWFDVGSVSENKQTEGKRLMYQWSVTSQANCQIVLAIIGQFLIAKREHGKLLLQYVNNHIKRSKIGWRTNAIPSIPDWEYEVFEKLAKLNRRTIKHFNRKPTIRKRKEGICPLCNSPFEYTHPRQRYCSASCSKEAIRIRDRARNKLRSK